MFGRTFKKKDVDSAISYLSYLFPQAEFEFKEDDDSISFTARNSSLKKKQQFLKNDKKYQNKKPLTITNEEIKNSGNRIIVGKTQNGDDLYWDQTTYTNLLISGYTGSGKTNLINTILRNIFLKNDSSIVYLSDERTRMPASNVIHQIRSDNELFEVLNKVYHITTDRNDILFELGDSIDDYGYIETGEHLIINDKLYKKDDMVLLMQKWDDEQVEMKAEDVYLLDNHENYMIIIPMKEGKGRIISELRLGRFKTIDGVRKTLIQPIYIIIEHRVNMYGKNELRIEEMLTKIMAIGRSANVHVIISGQVTTKSTLPLQMKCNIFESFIFSDIDDDQYRYITCDSNDFKGDSRLRNPGTAIHVDRRNCDKEIVDTYYTSEEELLDCKRIAEEAVIDSFNKCQMSIKREIGNINDLDDSIKPNSEG